jgi:hypothetical protein
MPVPVDADPAPSDPTLAQVNAALTATLDRLEALTGTGTAANDERRRLWRRVGQLQRAAVRLLDAED